MLIYHISLHYDYHLFRFNLSCIQSLGNGFLRNLCLVSGWRCAGSLRLSLELLSGRRLTCSPRLLGLKRRNRSMGSICSEALQSWGLVSPLFASCKSKWTTPLSCTCPASVASISCVISNVPQVLDRPWNQTVVLVRSEHLLLEILLFTCHRVRLPTPSLAIREYSYWIPIQCRLDIVLN